MNKVDIELIDPSVEPVSEKAHRVLRIGLGSVPVIGAAGAELFASIIESPMEVRKTKWMVQVSNSLNELIERGFSSLEELQSNENFITMLTQASALAIKTHHKEKLVALQNAVVNTALGEAPMDVMQDVFLSYIDSFSVAHIGILDFVKDPDKWMADHGVVDTFNWKKTIGTNNLMLAVHPDFKENPQLVNVIWMDMYRMQLIGNVSDDPADANSTSYTGLLPLGCAFLDFISERR